MTSIPADSGGEAIGPSGAYDGSMRSGRRARLVLGCAALALAAAPVSAGDTDEPTSRVESLESPVFEIRRDAERTLYQEGMSILAALAAGDENAGARVAVFDRMLAQCEGADTPAAARAAARVAVRLESSATDDQVRLVPRLLRVRVDRMLPLVVVDPLAEDRLDDARLDGRAVRFLFPQARPIVLDRVTTTDDPRTLAGALVTLCSEAGGGIEDDSDLEVIGAAWQKDSSRFGELSRFESVDGASPLVAVALALTLTGRARDLPRLVSGVDPSTWSLRTWIEPRLKARGQGDLVMGSFLIDVEEGRASAAIEAEAARRAFEANIPWLARLLARRALFLDPTSADATTVLVSASDAVGLHSAARKRVHAASGEAPVVDGRADDESAAAVDDALKNGLMSQRLAHRIEAGVSDARGVLPAALDQGRLVHSTIRGRIRVVETAKGKSLYAFGASLRRGAPSLAMRGDEVAAVGDSGDVTHWSLGPTDAELLRFEKGSAQAVAAGARGFWVAGFGLTIARITKEGIERFDGLTPIDQFVVRTLGVFSDDTLLVASNDAAWRVDPVAGKLTRIELPPQPTALAVCGNDLLWARGDRFVRYDRESKRVGGGKIPDGGSILGISAERDGSTVYVQTIDALYAMDATSGHERWVEHVEGSADPVVGDGFVVARAGAGSFQRSGDGRADRTFYLLRTSTSRRNPFGVAERERIVALATAIAADGRIDLVRALVDPVRSWLSSSENEAIDAATMAGRAGK